jgi:UDP-N-acetylglucosamine pyrophosphorylase
VRKEWRKEVNLKVLFFFSRDVRFGRNVKLAGTVILIASADDKLFIPDGAVLRDNIVIGSLTMTPH